MLANNPILNQMYNIVPGETPSIEEILLNQAMSFDITIVNKI